MGICLTNFNVKWAPYYKNDRIWKDLYFMSWCHLMSQFLSLPLGIRVDSEQY